MLEPSMRTFLVCLVPLALLACEDGPNQTYAPLPPGAGDLLNNGNPDAAVDPGGAGFDASFPTHSSTQICDQATLKAKWGKALDAPIIPPRLYANIDMAADDTWRGITVEEAEHINCQGIPTGDIGCDQPAGACGRVFWGNNAEVQFLYDLGTHVVAQMECDLGYT